MFSCLMRCCHHMCLSFLLIFFFSFKIISLIVSDSDLENYLLLWILWHLSFVKDSFSCLVFVWLFVCFLPLFMSHTCLFLCMPHTILLETEHLGRYIMATADTDYLLWLWGFLLLLFCLFVLWLGQTILVKSIFPSVGSLWWRSSKSTSLMCTINLNWNVFCKALFVAAWFLCSLIASADITGCCQPPLSLQVIALLFETVPRSINCFTVWSNTFAPLCRDCLWGESLRFVPTPGILLSCSLCFLCSTSSSCTM